MNAQEHLKERPGAFLEIAAALLIALVTGSLGQPPLLPFAAAALAYSGDITRIVGSKCLHTNRRQ